MEQEPRQRTVDRIAARLRRQILGGEHLPGTLMPPERVLAEQLDVNRLTLRAAYAQLAAEGLIQARQGQGVVVLDYREHGSLALLQHLDTPGLLEDVLELRRIVLAEAVALVTQRATFEDLADLADNDKALHQPGLDDELFAATHEAFLRRLVIAAGSLPLRLVFHNIEQWMDTRPTLRRALTADQAAVAATQAALLNLVRSGDPNLARNAVRRALGRIEVTALEWHAMALDAAALHDHDAPTEPTGEEPLPDEPNEPDEPSAPEEPDVPRLQVPGSLDIDDVSHDPLPGEGEE